MKTRLLYLLCGIFLVNCTSPDDIMPTLNGTWLASNEKDEGISALTFSLDSQICYVMVNYYDNLGEIQSASLPYDMNYAYPKISLFPKSNTWDIPDSYMRWLANETITGIVAVNCTDAEKAKEQLYELIDYINKRRIEWEEELSSLEQNNENGSHDEEIIELKNRIEQEEKKYIRERNRLIKAINAEYAIVLHHPETGDIGIFWH